jgi:putative membrane protein
VPSSRSLPNRHGSSESHPRAQGNPARVTNRRNSYKLFQQEAQSSQDAELKQFAQSTLPTLKEHLQMAQQIEQNMRAPQTSQSRSSTTGQSGSSTQRAR